MPPQLFTLLSAVMAARGTRLLRISSLLCAHAPPRHHAAGNFDFNSSAPKNGGVSPFRGSACVRCAWGWEHGCRMPSCGGSLHAVSRLGSRRCRRLCPERRAQPNLFGALSFFTTSPFTRAQQMKAA